MTIPASPRVLVALALVATATAVGGCSAESFSQLNATFGQVKKTTNAVGTTAMPAAAIATSLGAIELMKGLAEANKSAPKAVDPNTAKPAGIIAAGGGNLIANPRFTLMQAGADQFLEVRQNNVNANCTYRSQTGEDGSTNSEVVKFLGVTNGYNIEASGKFIFTPAEAGGAVRGRVHCEMTGKISYKDLTVDLKSLTFDTTDPIEKSKEIGSFVMEGSDGGSKVAIECKVSTTANGKIAAKGTLTQGTKKKPISFDEDQPQIAEAVEGTDAGGDGGK